jgi:hypothetical protein
MRKNYWFKKSIVLVCLTIFSLNLFGQDKLLSMKMIYSVPIMKGEIKSSAQKDSIEYSYIVDKRFWWQTFDKIIAQSNISYDTIVDRFSKTLKENFKREFTPNQAKTLIIRHIPMPKNITITTDTIITQCPTAAVAAETGYIPSVSSATLTAATQ